MLNVFIKVCFLVQIFLACSIQWHAYPKCFYFNLIKEWLQPSKICTNMFPIVIFTESVWMGSWSEPACGRTSKVDLSLLLNSIRMVIWKVDTWSMCLRVLEPVTWAPPTPTSDPSSCRGSQCQRTLKHSNNDYSTWMIIPEDFIWNLNVRSNHQPLINESTGRVEPHLCQACWTHYPDCFASCCFIWGVII